MKVSNRRVTSLNGDDKAVELLEQELFEPTTTKDEYDVVLTIDGVEIDLEKVVNIWNEHLENTLNSRALELFKEKNRFN